MTSVFATSVAGLNGAVRQFEAAAARIAGAPASAATPAPTDSVAIAGSPAPSSAISYIVDAMVARYSFDANAKALTIIDRTQKSLFDVKV